MSMIDQQESDRGFTLVACALLLVGLMLIASFAVDLGGVYVERREDQNAADSGATAGALELGGSDATVVAVNDPFLSVEYAAYQFKHDSVHGTYPGEVKVDGDVLFTGQLVGVEPKVTAGNKTIQCSGYSLPASLGDSTMPASEFPIEYGNMTLRQIAESLAKPFGIKVKVDLDTEDGPQFKRFRFLPAGDLDGPSITGLCLRLTIFSEGAQHRALLAMEFGIPVVNPAFVRHRETLVDLG